jgi:hypothetical protein
MFERYTEKARRVIFFARYEASAFGSPYIETEHMLLGLLREDKVLTDRFLGPHTPVESIKKQIEQLTVVRESTPTSVDLPLSNEFKRVLAYAHEEADRLANKQIGCEHLLLGLLREEGSLAARLLAERGVRIAEVRVSLGHEPHAGSGLGSGSPGSFPQRWPPGVPVNFITEDGSRFDLSLASAARIPSVGEWVTFAEGKSFIVLNVEWVYKLIGGGTGSSDQPLNAPQSLKEVKITVRSIGPATGNDAP